MKTFSHSVALCVYTVKPRRCENLGTMAKAFRLGGVHTFGDFDKATDTNVICNCAHINNVHHERFNYILQQINILLLLLLLYVLICTR